MKIACGQGATASWCPIVRDRFGALGDVLGDRLGGGRALNRSLRLTLRSDRSGPLGLGTRVRLRLLGLVALGLRTIGGHTLGTLLFGLACPFRFCGFRGWVRIRRRRATEKAEEIRNGGKVECEQHNGLFLDNARLF